MYVFVLFCLTVVFSYGGRFAHAEDSVCVEFGPQNITTCGNASTWAVNTSNLIVEHVANRLRTPPFSFKYILQRDAQSSVHCVVPINDDCGRKSQPDIACWCVGLSDDSMRVKVLIGEQTAGLTSLNYNVNSVSLDYFTIHNFTFKECSLKETNASAVAPSSDPCGFGCKSRFSCMDGYRNQDEDLNTTHECNAAAIWEPRVPICVEKPSSETPTEHSGDGCRTVAVLGGIAMFLTAALMTYLAAKGHENLFHRTMITCYTMYGGHIGVFVIAIATCFGMPNNKQAYVSGRILGYLSVAGMAALTIVMLLLGSGCLGDIGRKDSARLGHIGRREHARVNDEL